MRSGVVISAIFHVVLVSLVMLSTPRQFDAATAAVEVDLVREEDAPPRQDEPQPQPEPKPEKNAWDFPEEKLRIELPDFSRNANSSSAAPATKPAGAKQAAPPSGSQVSAASPQQTPSPTSQPVPSRPPPSNSQPAALTPQSPSSAQSPTPSETAGAPPSVFDPSAIPMLLDLPNAQAYGFDAEAITKANISADDRAAFKAHLRKCWKLPDGVSPTQSTRVVLRIFLRRDGALASDPILIEASASRDGPAVLMAAKRALSECQPFAFLPAEKYGEWKTLDLSFTPRDMAGG